MAIMQASMNLKTHAYGDRDGDGSRDEIGAGGGARSGCGHDDKTKKIKEMRLMRI